MSLREQRFSSGFGRLEWNSAGGLSLDDYLVRIKPFHVRLEVDGLRRHSAGAVVKGESGGLTVRVDSDCSWERCRAVGFGLSVVVG